MGKESAPAKRASIDIIGYGPIGRELSIKLANMPERFLVNSVADSSGALFPKSSSEVLEIARWKSKKHGNKLSKYPKAKIGNPLSAIESSKSTIIVDVTNSDYSKHNEARIRAILALKSGKHYVTANKAALAFHFREIFDIAGKKGLRIGFGATNISARHAIIVAQSMQADELLSAQSLLNSATTVILSSLERNTALSMDEAIDVARKEGILERDPAIDLDGWDAAAKTAILSNAIFPRRPISMNDVKRKGIRDEAAQSLIEIARKDPRKKVREVSEITRESALVEPKLIEAGTSLDVHGHTGIVVLNSKITGEIAIKSKFALSGIALTSSILLSDIMQIISANA